MSRLAAPPNRANTSCPATGVIHTASSTPPRVPSVTMATVSISNCPAIADWRAPRALLTASSRRRSIDRTISQPARLKNAMSGDCRGACWHAHRCRRIARDRRGNPGRDPRAGGEGATDIEQGTRQICGESEERDDRCRAHGNLRSPPGLVERKRSPDVGPIQLNENFAAGHRRLSLSSRIISRPMTAGSAASFVRQNISLMRTTGVPTSVGSNWRPAG